MEHDDYEYNNECQVIIEKLRRIKKEINEHHQAGDKEARDDAINDYVCLLNDDS